MCGIEVVGLRWMLQGGVICRSPVGIQFVLTVSRMRYILHAAPKTWLEDTAGAHSQSHHSTCAASCPVHRALARTRRDPSTLHATMAADTLASLPSVLSQGMHRAQGFSTDWWKSKHNTHHAAPNELAPGGGGVAVDPDIDTLPLLAWSEGMLDALSSARVRRLLRAQHYYFVPIMMLARLAWAQQSAEHAWRLGRVRHHPPSQHSRSFGCASWLTTCRRLGAFCAPIRTLALPDLESAE